MIDINKDYITTKNINEWLSELDKESIRRTGKPSSRGCTKEYWLAHYSQKTITEIIDYLIVYMGAKDIIKTQRETKLNKLLNKG